MSFIDFFQVYAPPKLGGPKSSPFLNLSKQLKGLREFFLMFYILGKFVLKLQPLQILNNTFVNFQLNLGILHVTYVL